MLRSVERVLDRDYSVATSPSSLEALSLARQARPDLAILDIQMPEMDGFQLMEQLQTLDSELDVIFMTGSTHDLDAKLIKAIRRDAFYFLEKPFDREVLLCLVDRCLERRRLARANREYQARMERELGDARAFQRSILGPPLAVEGRISIAARYVPSSELGGDFYDYVFLPDGAAMLIADVSGHGASAAMITASVKSAFHSAGAERYEPASVVDRISAAIRPFGHHHFVTLVCARVRDGNLDYVNAGHPSGILSQSGRPALLLEATGPIVSPAFIATWQQKTIALGSGAARLVLFTDGLTDVESDGLEYGLDRLVDDVGRAIWTGAGELSAHLLESVRRFAGDGPIDDDLTLLVADLQPDPSTHSR